MSFQNQTSDGDLTKPKLKVLVSSLLSHGHMNVCFAIGKRLLEQGHEVCFTVDNDWKKRAEKLGFKTILLTKNILVLLAAIAFEFKMKKISRKQHKSWDKPIDTRVSVETQLFLKLIDLMKRLDPIMTNLIKKYNPDVIDFAI